MTQGLKMTVRAFYLLSVPYHLSDIAWVSRVDVIQQETKKFNWKNVTHRFDPI